MLWRRPLLQPDCLRFAHGQATGSHALILWPLPLVQARFPCCCARCRRRQTAAEKAFCFQAPRRCAPARPSLQQATPRGARKSFVCTPCVSGCGWGGERDLLAAPRRPCVPSCCCCSSTLPLHLSHRSRGHHGANRCTSLLSCALEDALHLLLHQQRTCPQHG